MSIIIGIDHGYYAIKTALYSFPAGLTSYGEHEPYTRQGLLEFGGCFFVCGSGRQPMQTAIWSRAGPPAKPRILYAGWNLKKSTR